jgi:hypothetical protein
MADVERAQVGEQRRRSTLDAMAALPLLVTIFGVGFAALPAVFAIKEPLGVGWFAVLLIVSIILTLGGGAGAIYVLRVVWPHRAARIPGRAGWISRQLIWFPPLLVTTFSLTLWLTAKDSKGNEFLPRLAIPLFIVGLTITVSLFIVSRNQVESSSKTLTPWVALPVAILLGMSSGFLYWNLIHKADIQAANRIHVHVPGGQGLKDNDQAAVIQILDMPPKRRHLALILNLTNLSAKVSDCVNPAELNITPVIDSLEEVEEPKKLRPRDEARFDLTGVTHEASLKVTLSEPDKDCAVNLDILEAVLYN